MMKHENFIFRLIIFLVLTLFMIFTGCKNPLEEQFIQSLAEEESEAQELITEVLNTPANVPVDTTPPAVSFVNPLDGHYYSGILLIAGVAADASEVVSVETKLDDGSWESQTPGQYWSYNLNTGLITEGAHTIYARAEDVKGNESNEVSVSFIVDRDVPEVHITSHTNGDYVKGTITYSGTASDNLDIVTVSISPDGGGTYYEAVGTDTWSYSGFDTTSSAVGDGSLIVLVEARDDANNRGTESILLVVDNTPPEIIMSSPLNQATIETASIEVAGTAMDAIGLEKVEVNLDDTGTQPAELADGSAGNDRIWSFTIDTSALTSGPHTLSAVATDYNENFVVSDEITFYFDDTPPEVTITEPAASGNSLNAASITISGNTANADSANLDSVEYSLDDVSYSSVDSFTTSADPDWTHSLDVSGLADGLTTVYIKATDATTYAWGKDSVNFYLDREAPTGTFSSPSEGSEAFANLQVSGTVSDNVELASVQPVAVYIEDSTTPAATTAIAYPPVTGGLWSAQFDLSSAMAEDACIIHVTFTDEAGNSTGITRNFSITDTVPSGTISSPSNGELVTSAGFTVTGTAAGGTGYDVAAVEIKVNDREYAAATDTSGAGTWASWSYDTDTAGITPDGYHSLTARITNSNGDGVSIEIPITIEVDNTAPDVTIDYPTDANIGNDDYLYGTVDASGSASDEHLNTLSVLVDSVSQGAPAGTESWSYSWNTAGTPGARNGTVFTVQATDLAGNVGVATANVDVRPRITTFQSGATEVKSVLIDASVDIIGNNFRDDLPAGAPVLNVVFPASTLASTAASASQITVTVPSDAESGYVYVEEGDDGTGSPIQSNREYLHIWQHFDGVPAATADQAMAVSGTDRYQVGYKGAGNPKELFFSKNGGTEVYLDSTKSQQPSIAVVSPYIYIVYNANGTLTFQSSTDDINFSTEAGFPAVTLTGGSWTSIDAFSTTVGLVYQNSSGYLGYTVSTDNGVSWSVPENVDTSVTGGFYSEIAYDSTGNPCVVYYDETNQMACFAYRNAGGWNTSTIEPGILQGEYIAVAIDSADGIHVSYYDAMSGDLKYAYAEDKYSDFSISTVTNTGILGMWTDIALDSEDNPHISYYNYNYSTIHYAYLDNSEAWQVVDFPAGYAASSALRSSIQVGSDDYIYIGYTNGEPMVLQYRK